MKRRRKRPGILLCDVLETTAVITGFIGMSGLAGAIDTDTVTAGTYIWAAVFLGMSAATGLLAWIEHGKSPGERQLKRGKEK